MLEGARGTVNQQRAAADNAQNAYSGSLRNFNDARNAFGSAVSSLQDARNGVNNLCSIVGCDWWVPGWVCDSAVNGWCYALRATAYATLSAAEATVSGVSSTFEAAKNGLADATIVRDVANAGLDVANGALSVAQESLNGKDALLAVVNVGFAAASAAVEGSRHSLTVAEAALTATNGVLEGVRVTVAVGLQAAQWVAVHKVTGIISIERLEFDLDLDTRAITETKFAMKMTARILQAASVTVGSDIDLADIPGTALRMAELVFNGISDIALRALGL